MLCFRLLGSKELIINVTMHICSFVKELKKHGVFFKLDLFFCQEMCLFRKLTLWEQLRQIIIEKSLVRCGAQYVKRVYKYFLNKYSHGA